MVILNASLENAVVYLSVTNSSRILTIEKQNSNAHTKLDIKTVIKTWECICIWCCINFIALEGHKNFVASLIDPFLVDCVIFH